MKRIIKLLSDSTDYRGKNGYIAEFMEDDNTKSEGFVLKSRGDLWLYMSCSVKNKLTEREFEKLQELITDFGTEEYCDGFFDSDNDRNYNREI